MKAVAMEPLTVEDYRLLPDAGPRYQLIGGGLVYGSSAQPLSSGSFRKHIFVAGQVS
jgi:hypothetical protein